MSNYEIGNNQLAEPIHRLLAAIIDGLVIGGLSLIPFGAIAGAAYLLTRDALPFFDGQSIGKKLLNLKVYSDTTGESITNDYTTAIIRSVTLLIPIFNIFDAAMVLTHDKIRFGDKIARTKVYKVN